MDEITEKQLKANQENAKLGGVKTPEGKEVSKFNALKHGLLSKEVLLREENVEELNDFGYKLRNELLPANELENILVDRMISGFWRLKRALRIETQMIEDDCGGDGDFLMKKKGLGEALSYDFANYDTYGKFVRYEASIERGIYRAWHELQRLQASRNGQVPTPPLTIDIDIPNNSE